MAAARTMTSRGPADMDTKAAAKYVGVDPRTLEGYRSRGGGPDFVRISARLVRYRKADLDDWLNERTVTTAAATKKAS